MRPLLTDMTRFISSQDDSTDAMKCQIIKILEEIKADCINLKRTKKLTEYGKGQLDLIKIIEQNK